jgi:hypothetical protein
MVSDIEREHLYALLHGSHGLRICGCGTPDESWNLVRALLEATAACYGPDDRFLGWSGYKVGGEHPYDALCGSAGAAGIVSGALETSGLLEHGGNFYGSWLTDQGRVYLSLMRDCGYDDLEETGFPHEGAPCPDSCPYSIPATTRRTVCP